MNSYYNDLIFGSVISMGKTASYIRDVIHVESSTHSTGTPRKNLNSIPDLKQYA